MRFLTLITIAILLYSCSGEEEAPVSNPQPPAWSDGYPKVMYGASTVDLVFQTQNSAEIYYLVSDKPLQYTAEQLRQHAEYPDTSAIKSSGKIELNAATEFTQKITFLEQNKEHFVYVIAQGRSGNLFSEIKTQQFTTHVRQDTAAFDSEIENRNVKYLIYRPEQALKYPDENYPVCFSFGDKNSVATDFHPINLIRDGSLPEYIHQFNDVPMIVISIQGITATWNLDLIAEGIDHALNTYAIDPNRIYLTGYGEGAIACWNYAISHSEQVAAIVPVSGKGDVSNACSLANVDVWAFHNETDDIIASTNTKKMVNAISKCPPQKELSEIYFPDTGHNCWKRVYNHSHSDWSKSPGIPDFNIYTWMLSKSKI